MTADEMREQSRAAQGLPPTIDDPAAVARLASLLRTRTDRPEGRPAESRLSGARSGVRHGS